MSKIGREKGEIRFRFAESDKRGGDEGNQAAGAGKHLVGMEATVTSGVFCPKNQLALK